MARMGRQRVPEVTPPPHDQPKSLVASAARMRIGKSGLASWNNFRFGDDGWQQEAWRLYDLVGELRFAANWIGSACSRVRLYIAEVDKNGRVQQETEKKKVSALADTMFGSPAAKSEALRMLGINLTVAGEAYVIGRDTKKTEDDEWFVVSGSELRRIGRGMNAYYGFVDSDGKFLGGDENKLNPETDIIIRIWTPHPRRNLWPDSPTRGAMAMLLEIEKLTRFVFAQIDSRLVSAGILWIPRETSFPTQDGDEQLTGAEALTDKLMEIASMSLKGEGTAAGVVPLIAEMPLDALGKIQLTQFVSELSQQARELREEALARFATAMDMPPEILKGTGDTNHWSSWHVEESAVKVHIEPLMTRICDGLNAGYLKSALKAIGEDPERFIFWFDTAPLTVRPQKLQDTHNLYKDGIVRKEAVIVAGDYKLTDMPDEDEDMRRFTRELMLRDPNLFQIPKVREIAGYSAELLPPDTVVTPQAGPGAGPPPPPAPPTGIAPTGAPTPIPAESTAEGAPTPVAPAQVASAATSYAMVPDWAITAVVANGAVLRALELAGKRMLTASIRGRVHNIPPYELHTVIPAGNQERAEEILRGAWDTLAIVASTTGQNVDVDKLRETLHTYCIQLILTQHPHSVDLLGMRLEEVGLVHGLP